jgi:RHS repeat-associated protein
LTNGNTTSMQGPNGETKYLYDAKNRLSKQTDPVAGTFEWTYNALDRRMTLKYPNNLTTYYDYDNAYRMKSLITKNNQGDIIDGYSYIMDAVGNRTSMTSLRDNQVTSYEYDETYRLTKATYPWDASESFTYDDAGNRLTLTDKDNVTTSYTYDYANRLTKEMIGAVQKVGYTWDAAGNMLSKTDDLNQSSTYEWNYDSRLVRTTSYQLPAASYGYDPSGIRVRITEDTVTKRFLYSSEDIIAEYGGASEMYYVHGPLIDEPLAQIAGSGASAVLSYIHRDGLGSVTAFSSTAGQLVGSAATYNSFGKVHDQAGVSSRYGYTSRELDSSGLMYYRSRYYQPEIGRFLNQDFYQGIELVPPSLHRYLYTHNNPINYADPTGQMPFLWGLYFLITPWIPLLTMIFLVVGAFLIGYWLGIMIRQIFGLEGMTQEEEKILGIAGSAVIFVLGLVVITSPNGLPGFTDEVSTWASPYGYQATYAGAGQCVQAATDFVQKRGGTILGTPNGFIPHRYVFYQGRVFDPTLRANLETYHLEYADIPIDKIWFSIQEHAQLIQRMAGWPPGASIK